MTELVFRDDAYVRSCTARVVAADGRGIVIDTTVALLVQPAMAATCREDEKKQGGAAHVRHLQRLRFGGKMVMLES